MSWRWGPQQELNGLPVTEEQLCSGGISLHVREDGGLDLFMAERDAAGHENPDARLTADQVDALRDSLRRRWWAQDRGQLGREASWPTVDVPHASGQGRFTTTSHQGPALLAQVEECEATRQHERERAAREREAQSLELW